MNHISRCELCGKEYDNFDGSFYTQIGDDSNTNITDLFPNLELVENN